MLGKTRTREVFHPMKTLLFIGDSITDSRRLFLDTPHSPVFRRSTRKVPAFLFFHSVHPFL